MKAGKESRINLLRYQQEAQQERKTNTRFIGILALVALLLVGAMGGLWWMQNEKLQAVKAQNQQLQQQVDNLSKSVAAIPGASTKDTGKVDIRTTMINALEKQVKAKTKYFDEIYLLSIPNVTIGKMDIKSDNSFTMSAYCQGQTKFIKFLEQVRELGFVEEVKNVSSRYNAKTGEVNFNLTLVVRGEAE